MSFRSLRNLTAGVILSTTLLAAPAVFAQSVTGTDPVPRLPSKPSSPTALTTILMILGLA